MQNEIVEKNLERLIGLLRELKRYLDVSFSEFSADAMRISAAERKFQLIVDIASDINAHLLVSSGNETPDTYRRSFTNLGRAGILPHECAEKLAESAGIRNILVHEYDFEEDYQKFYASAKEILPWYDAYIDAIRAHIVGKK